MAEEGREEDTSSYLVSTTRLRDLFLQEPEERRDRDGYVQWEGWSIGECVERAFRSDIDITTPDHLVSLGLTWSKLEEFIRNEGQGYGVLWMGQDTYLHQDHPEHELLLSPLGFRELFAGSTEKEHKEDFDFIVFGTNPTSASYGHMMNLLAEINSLDESITHLCMRAEAESITSSMLNCPTTALGRFITKPTSKRRYLRFDSNLRISNEQSQVLFSGGCSGNINIEADFENLEDGGAVLIEAIRSSQSPAKQTFSNIELMPETRFVEFVDALGSSESLKEVQICGRLSDQRIAVMLPVLVSNNRLKSLSLRCNMLSNDRWQHFWSLIAQNLSINHLDVRGNFGWLESLRVPDDLKVPRDMCIVEALKTNTVLADINYTPRDHDPQIMLEMVLPKLEVNRFRPRIQAMRQVPNDSVRGWLVGKALLHQRVREHAAIRFLLLLVNSDLAFFWVMKKNRGKRSRPSKDNEDETEGTD